MATPKKLLKTISLTPKKILQPRREELLEQIQKDGTYLPKGIYHADLDRGMLDFVKNDLGINVNGKVVNTVDGCIVGTKITLPFSSNSIKPFTGFKLLSLLYVEDIIYK
jgi:hypothetical protein